MAKNLEKFSVDFILGGTAAITAKTAAAPIERVKLLLQNQGELVKRGQLQRPYGGIGDCFQRVLKEEGVLSFINVATSYPRREARSSYDVWS